MDTYPSLCGRHSFTCHQCRRALERMFRKLLRLPSQPAIVWLHYWSLRLHNGYSDSAEDGINILLKVRLCPFPKLMLFLAALTRTLISLGFAFAAPLLPKRLCKMCELVNNTGKLPITASRTFGCLAVSLLLFSRLLCRPSGTLQACSC